MYIIIDIGNTRAKYAIFDHNIIVLQGVVLRRYSISTIGKLLKKFEIKAGILSSTSEISMAFLDILRKIPFFIHLDMETPIPIQNLYSTPLSLGKDRLAAAVGAFKRSYGKPVLFIDMGTCITMNLLNEAGAFIGGNISPGIRMRLKAMHKFTAKLPLVEPDIPAEDFAPTTVKALQNGAVKGTFREIDSFIDDTRVKFGVNNIILTGGDAGLFESYTKNKIFVAPNLVLEGLNEILKYNVK
ncbi:MAG: type III pantothenate kinase [Saprospiraceae bacterium]|nr:type III pantothenate kinase [Saprospiraceae bacterium]